MLVFSGGLASQMDGHRVNISGRNNHWKWCVSISRSLSFFRCLSCFFFAFLFYIQFCCPLYHLSFPWNCIWLSFQEPNGGIFIWNRVVGKKLSSTQNVGRLFVTLAWLVRMSKSGFLCSDFSLLNALLTNLHAYTESKVGLEGKISIVPYETKTA